MTEGTQTALIQEPMALMAYFAALLGAVFMLAECKNQYIQKFFHYAPPLIWAYFLPMLSTTFGITPAQSPLYSFVSAYILPFGLLLLLLSMNVSATLRLGPKALFLFLSGTIGVVIGGPIALAIFQPFLPEDAWKGVAALAGSWIGGSANMAAMIDAVGTPKEVLAPVIVVDTVVGYSWMGIMIALAGFQHKFNKWNKADNSVVENLNKQIGAVEKERSRPIQVPQFLGMLGLGLGVAFVVRKFAEMLPVTSVMSASTWTIMIISAVGVILSFTKVRKLEDYGASKIGYAGIYLLLTTIGAQADLVYVIEAPHYMLLGVVWLMIHIICIFLAARIMRAPLFFVAVGSQSNIGGTSSAPVVASVFQPALAPVGLLMAIVGNVVGTYAAVLCAHLAEFVAKTF
ncbi:MULTISPECIES: DUF819 domain-containing protein [Bacillus cereus group]|uniref:DUF819 domain-containing protein n=1 Tax=Bacillus cereus TaxID=1396 RepID=A0AA44QFA8_BACCE|nr:MULTISPECIES: DUF819 family protein [Bacillus cereus group]EEL50366.1 hypothetical protein bcere0022_22600 [Bacillus cereus Rock3-44]PFA17637.1 DUF819 domain-containing protein [Bacillus cereus]PFN00436.1 DUF819 domain-containing protein [Bacillus cereus]PFO78916.1 DUF819 domain-containing protein [Bacillus cereus]PFS08036.1 DUF819 domain-containing protein [Bacillus cereus]